MNPKSSDRRKRLEELKKDIKDKRKVIESAELGLIRLKQEHNATQAAIAAGSSAQVIANQEVINQGVKKASLLIPHTTDL